MTERNPIEIWRLWAEPERWADWDPDVASVDFSGPFVAGARGSLKPTSGPRATFHVVSATTHEAFVTSTRLPGCSLRFYHELREDGNRMLVVHRIEMTGWSAPLFARLIGRRLAPGLAAAVRNVAVGPGEPVAHA